MKILVTGAAGFIGSRIVTALRVEERPVRALVHRPESASQLAGSGAEVVVGDVTDPAAVLAAAEGCTHVVHLVSILRGRPDDFERVMTGGTRNLVAAAQSAGSERIVLMSAIGATDAPGAVPYYRAKAQMEQAVRDSGADHVIFRPGFVFGSDAGALTTFMKQVRSSPVVTVIGNGRQRFAPIWVDDVAAYVTQAIDLPAAANRVFEVGGPDIVDWNELYRRIARTLHKRRAFVNIPFSVARAGARATQSLPGAPLTLDQVEMIAGADLVPAGNDAVETFNVPLVPLDEQLRRAA